MDFKLSYNWLKELAPVTLEASDLAKVMSLHGASVECVHEVGGEWNNIVIGRVMDVVAHPNADKLKIVIVQATERYEVVCGGTNVRVGMVVALALPGAHVRWHGEGALVELKPTEIRGVKSTGMICAANEIGLVDLFVHREREVLDLTPHTKAHNGTPLAEAFGLHDTILDVEVTSNRPDMMCVQGLAREVDLARGARER